MSVTKLAKTKQNKQTSKHIKIKQNKTENKNKKKTENNKKHKQTRTLSYIPKVPDEILIQHFYHFCKQ